tara:strand:- start:364 stop:633 length:270 start_codon:yes stop_codon:yes gene_type:complete
MKRIKREKSKYFPSVGLKRLDERPKYIQEEAKAVIADVSSQFRDYIGRASDQEIRDLCSLMACGKPHKRTTRVQKIFTDAINEVKNKYR